MNIIFWVLALYGCTQIIVESTLFKPIRGLFKFKLVYPIHILLTCMICTSTWIAFIYSIWWFSPSSFIYGDEFINGIQINFFIDGMFGSCLVWFIHRFESLLNDIKFRLTYGG